MSGRYTALGQVCVLADNNMNICWGWSASGDTSEELRRDIQRNLDWPLERLDRNAELNRAEVPA